MNRSNRPAWRVVLVAATGLVLLVGCEGFGKKELPPEPAPPARSAAADDALLAGTIGAETIMSNMDVQPLRGFGLVTGLNGRGSSDCPTVIRDYLVEYMTKDLGPQGTGERRKGPTPAELIDSPDTAVVEVTGVVAPGSRRGASFDLYVRAVLGTSTGSLEGGLLLPTQMRYFDRAASGQGLVAGAVLATARGPLFVNPYAELTGDESAADERQAIVLGGGRANVERPTRLTLLRPNYQLAQAMQRRINERFGRRPKPAEAISAGYLELKTPPPYAGQPLDFRRLVTQLYIDNRPGQSARRLRELARRAAVGNDDLDRIALTWEGMGRGVLADIQPYYAHAEPALRFYAARAGLRLGDLSALAILDSVAADGGHAQRLDAVRELGHSHSPQAITCLVPLLGDADPDVRIAAYEALLTRGNPAIRSLTFRHILDQTQLNFVLDVVESGGPPLIHVRRTRLPRIAVFGPRMSVTTPVFYTHPDDLLTIHTVGGSDDLQLFAKRGGRMSEQVVAPPLVVELIAALGDLPLRDKAGRLRGLGLPYSTVVRVIATLAEDQTVPTEVVLERTVVSELLGPEPIPERPEGELPESESQRGGSAAESSESTSE